ncbi:MAG: HEAT repeat domain-containing protein [Leptospiraceae bacterium]|nr:HEAT repeat domain-containing protein [Leptospiraceae bacterium]
MKYLFSGCSGFFRAGLAILLLLFLFGNCQTQILKQKKEDPMKESLLSEDSRVQKLAISKILPEKRYDLLPFTTSILQNPSSPTELKLEILQFYFDNRETLASLYPEWEANLNWVLHSSGLKQEKVLCLNFLKETKNRDYLHDVMDLLSHRSLEVREAVYAYIAVLKDDRALPYLLELVNTSKDIYRYYYLESLQYIEDERLTLYLDELLEHKSPAMRTAVILAIESYKLDKAHTLIKLATGDSNYEVRKHAVLAIRNQNLKNRAYILKETLFDSHPEVREVSISSVNRFNIRYFSNYISKALEEEPLSDLRIKMIESLLHLNHHGGGKGLSVALKEDSSVEVRMLAARAIATLKAKMNLPDLLTSLRVDTSVEVKKEIARSLGVMKDKVAIPSILNGLQDRAEDLGLKIELVATLEKIDEPRVMPLLFDLIETEDEKELRLSMKSLLRRMLYKYHRPSFSLRMDRLSSL